VSSQWCNYPPNERHLVAAAGHMPVAIPTAEQDLDRRVLAEIATRRGHTPSELITHLENKLDEDQDHIRAAIWRLLSDGKLELTSERKLRVHR